MEYETCSQPNSISKALHILLKVNFSVAIENRGENCDHLRLEIGSMREQAHSTVELLAFPIVLTILHRTAYISAVCRDCKTMTQNDIQEVPNGVGEGK